MSDDGHVTDVLLLVHHHSDLVYCEIHLLTKDHELGTNRCFRNIAVNHIQAYSRIPIMPSCKAVQQCQLVKMFRDDEFWLAAPFHTKSYRIVSLCAPLRPNLKMLLWRVPYSKQWQSRLALVGFERRKVKIICACRFALLVWRANPIYRAQNLIMSPDPNTKFIC